MLEVRQYFFGGQSADAPHHNFVGPLEKVSILAFRERPVSPANTLDSRKCARISPPGETEKPGLGFFFCFSFVL